MDFTTTNQDATIHNNDSTPTAMIINTSHSPFARLRPLSLAHVQLDDTFWTRYREVNRTVVLPLQYQQCEVTGRLNNFRRAAGLYQGAFEGIFFNDSDVYKWLEAASWTLATQEAAQRVAGYSR